MRLFTSFFVFAMLFFPSVVFGSEHLGLVPCDGGVGDPCEFCDLVTLVNNIITWLIGILTLVAVFLIVVAGFKLVISGGNPTAKEEAKKMFANAVIGFILVLSAWLIVDTIMKALVKNEIQTERGVKFGPWNQIECVRQPVAGTGTGGTGGTGGVAPEVTREDSFANKGVCNEDFLTEYFGTEAAAASCIAKGESVCGAKLYSTIDLDENKVPFSVGFMHINLTVHEVSGCEEYGYTSMNCSEAYNGKNYTAEIVNRDLYDTCVAALMVPECSAINAERIRDTKGSWADWSTAGGCGLI